MLVLVLSIGFIAKAQFTEQNQKVIGGTFSLNRSKSNIGNLPGNEVEWASFLSGTSYGIFAKKNWLSSFGVFYWYTNSKNITLTNVTKNPANNISVFYSKTYFKGIAKKLYLGFGGSATALYGTTKVKETANTNGSKSISLQAGIDLFPLLSYQLTERFVLNLIPSNNFLHVGYNYTALKSMPANQPAITGKYQSFNINGSFWSSPLDNLSIGFNYLLKKK